MDDGSLQGVRASEQPAGQLHLARLQGPADAAAADRAVEAADLSDLGGPDPQVAAQSDEQIGVPFAAASEIEIGPDVDLPHAETRGQVLLDEALGRDIRQLHGERQDQQELDSGRLDQGQFLLPGGEHEGRALGRQHLERVRVEGDQQAAAARGAAALEDGRHDGPVAAVQAVEVSDSCHRRIQVGPQRRDVVEDSHGAIGNPDPVRPDEWRAIPGPGWPRWRTPPRPGRPPRSPIPPEAARRSGLEGA